MQKLPKKLGPAVPNGKDKTHKTLETMCSARAWLQQCWKSFQKSCANGSNIVALVVGDHGTKEMLGVVDSKVWSVSNSAQQHSISCNRARRRTQHVLNIQQCWVSLHGALVSRVKIILSFWTHKFKKFAQVAQIKPETWKCFCIVPP